MAVTSVGLAFVLGTLLGAIAGYYRGFRDGVIMRVMDIILAFPYILLAIVVVAYLGPSLRNAMIAIGITYVPRFARIVQLAASWRSAAKTMSPPHAPWAPGTGGSS